MWLVGQQLVNAAPADARARRFRVLEVGLQRAVPGSLAAHCANCHALLMLVQIFFY